jgi:tRNA nucleotidyltransferase (CCA-adding enzyme)
MLDKIKPEVLQIYNSLEKAGFEVFFVGGCVRDLLLDKQTKDWDLTTNAQPSEIQKVFPDSFYDNLFGTVGVKFQEINEDNEEILSKNYVEITTYRSESGYKDRRHPESVTWGKTIDEDLTRRDFTVNAIAAKIIGEKLELIDPFNGQEDLKSKLIKAVRNPQERFKEDGLRLMRAVRLATQLGFTIEDKTKAAITEDALLIQEISGERIRDELLKILATENPYDGIALLDEVGILKYIFPELEEGKGISQTRPGRHHTTDVFNHNILSLKFCTSTDPIVRLATLLHDVGKPYVAAKDESGHVIFYNHEVKGAILSKEISERLRLSKKQKEKIYTLIRWHMFTVDTALTDSAIRRFIRRVGVENVADMMDLRIGDRLGGGTQVAESWRLKKFKERITEQLNPPFSINDLAIDGNDIMELLKLKPGPEIGKILKTLFDEVDEDLSKNTREYLLKRVKEVQ